MATPGVMLREVLFNTRFEFLTETSTPPATTNFGISGGFEVRGTVERILAAAQATDVADTVNAPAFETTTFASMAGILANHPLRNRWLQKMGLSPDIDVDVL